MFFWFALLFRCWFLNAKNFKIVFDTHEQQYVIFILRSQCACVLFLLNCSGFCSLLLLVGLLLFLFRQMFLYHISLMRFSNRFCLLICLLQANAPNAWPWVMCIYFTLYLSNFNLSVFFLSCLEWSSDDTKLRLWWTDDQNSAERIWTHCNPPTVKHQLKIACATLLGIGLMSVRLPLNIVAPYGKSSFQWLFRYGFVRRTLSHSGAVCLCLSRASLSAHADFVLFTICTLLTFCLLTFTNSLAYSRSRSLSEFRIDVCVRGCDVKFQWILFVISESTAFCQCFVSRDDVGESLGFARMEYQQQQQQQQK